MSLALPPCSRLRAPPSCRIPRRAVRRYRLVGTWPGAPVSLLLRTHRGGLAAAAAEPVGSCTPVHPAHRSAIITATSRQPEPQSLARRTQRRSRQPAVLPGVPAVISGGTPSAGPPKPSFCSVAPKRWRLQCADLVNQRSGPRRTPLALSGRRSPASPRPAATGRSPALASCRPTPGADRRRPPPVPGSYKRTAGKPGGVAGRGSCQH